MAFSTHENIALRDANSNIVATRTRDISSAQDGTLQRPMLFSTPYPVDYGTGGCFQVCVKSGSMAAGLASGATIFSMRNSSTTLNVILRRMRLHAWTLGTGFAAGFAVFNLTVARGFTSSDSGGTVVSLLSKNGALRAATMSSSALADLRVASTGTLTAGTRTLDVNPVDSLTLSAPTGTNTSITSTPVSLFERFDGDHPLVLGQNEGMLVTATVPATGVWGFAITAQWDEVPLVNY
jgi:hypothetical protein